MGMGSELWLIRLKLFTCVSEVTIERAVTALVTRSLSVFSEGTPPGLGSGKPKQMRKPTLPGERASKPSRGTF